MNYSASHVSLLGASQSSDLASNSMRLIRTRWVAGIMVLLATIASVRIMGLTLPEMPMYAVGIAILTYNAGLTWLTRRSYTPNSALYQQRIRQIVVLQITMDWLSMGIFLHLTGGVTSPAIVFFFIHVVMVNILLPGQSPYIYVLVAITGVALLLLMEATGILPHYTTIPGVPCELCKNPLYGLSEVAFFAVGLLATTFVASSIMDRLRERERQIGALLQTAQDVNSTLDLAATLDRLAFNAAVALSVKGSSIRLLEKNGEQLRMVSSHGLSKMYLDKGPVELSNSPLDREALAGHPVIINEPASDMRIQYPREMVEEGIHSLLVVPIIGQQRPLGILRVYASAPDCFNDENAEFVMAIAQQGAIAIENALAHNALRMADQERAQFVRIVTHELRAPVTGAQSLATVLSRSMVGELTPGQQDIVTRLERRLSSLLTLISDLLAFAEGKAVDLKQSLTPVSLSATLDLVVEQVSLQAASKNIALRYERSEKPLMMQATQEGLARALVNLIGNAVKYTPESGTVRVKTQRENGNVLVIIEDTGIGIPDEALAHLGEEFFRAQNARESGIPGTGLGLAIVKQLVEYFDGLMSIQSIVGAGTTITLTLPLIKDIPSSSDEPGQ